MNYDHVLINGMPFKVIPQENDPFNIGMKFPASDLGPAEYNFVPNSYVGDFEPKNWNHRDEDGLGVLVDNYTPFKPISGVERKKINGTVYRVVDSMRPETIPGYVPGCTYIVPPGRSLVVDWEHADNLNSFRM